LGVQGFKKAFLPALPLPPFLLFFKDHTKEEAEMSDRESFNIEKKTEK